MRALLGAFDAPVVQLWGWPGTGKRAILAALLEDEPEREHLPAAWLRAPERLEERLSRAVGRRAALLVCEDDRRCRRDRARLALVLGPGSGCWSRSSGVSTSDATRWRRRPNSFCCAPTRSARSGDATAGRALTTGEQRAGLHRRSDGWYFPLALWARDPATADGPFDDEARFGCEAIADFLRERVLCALDAPRSSTGARAGATRAVRVASRGEDLPRRGETAKSTLRS